METKKNFYHSDRVLIERVQSGNPESFRILYNLISGKMYSLCLRYARDREDANDFFQEGWIRLYKNINSFRHEGSFEGWARRIFVNACLDCMKKSPTGFSNPDALNSVSVIQNSVHDKQSLDDLMNIIQSLPDQLRLIVNLHLIEGYAHKDIACMLDITENACRSRMWRARIYLQNILNYTYVDE